MPQVDAEKVTDCMLAAVSRHGSQLPRHVPKEFHGRPRLETVLIIGSRGGLGSELLAQLLAHSFVNKIYALNLVHTDNKTLKSRQRDEFACRGINPSFLESSKLVLLEGETREPNLGLKEVQFHEIAMTVTAVILNGWRVNFASSLDDFEPVMAGTRRLIEMTLASPHKYPLRFIFSSSIGIFQNIDTRKPLQEMPTPVLQLAWVIRNPNRSWNRCLELPLPLDSPLIL